MWLFWSRSWKITVLFDQAVWESQVSSVLQCLLIHFHLHIPRKSSKMENGYRMAIESSAQIFAMKWPTKLLEIRWSTTKTLLTDWRKFYWRKKTSTLQHRHQWKWQLEENNQWRCFERWIHSAWTKANAFGKRAKRVKRAACNERMRFHYLKRDDGYWILFVYHVICWLSVFVYWMADSGWHFLDALGRKFGPKKGSSVAGIG